MFGWFRRQRAVARQASSAPQTTSAQVPDEPATDIDSGKPADREVLAGMFTSMLGNGAWCVDSVREVDGWIEVVGWAIAPGRDAQSLGFTLNDRAFDEIRYPLPREDLARVIWYTSEGQSCGFQCRMRGRLDEMCSDGVGVLKFVVRATGKAIREEHSYYFDLKTADRELPPPHLRTRVHGSPDEAAFRLEGYTNFVKLQLALHRLFGKKYHDFDRILDWGCGCGRFSRYFQDLGLTTQVTGADIDREAVDWVTDHLPVAGVVLPLHPPSPLASDGFDLITGISIFTHLGERDQFDWLGELQRIASTGAVLLMSIHGDTAVSRQSWTLEKLRTWRETGFHAGVTRDLVDVLPEADADYYKTTCHTRDYIVEQWSKYFEIVEIIPGYVGNLQDLVVMVRR